MVTGTALSTDDGTGLSFAEVQALHALYPKAIARLGSGLERLKAGYFGPVEDYNSPAHIFRWKHREVRRAEVSIGACSGCTELTHCKQPECMAEAGFGGGLVGQVRVLDTSACYLVGAVAFCKWKRLAMQEAEKPWLSKRQAEMTFVGFAVADGNRAAFIACNQYVRDLEAKLRQGRGLVLQGPTGVGKTHLASAVFREALHKEKVSGSFIVVADYLDELRNRYGEKSNETSRAFMASVVDSTLLVMDNLELRNVTPWVVDTIFGIIDLRYRMMRSTIVTTGWSPKQMAAALEEKVPSRLAQMCEWYGIDEVDYRRAGKKRPKKPRRGRG